MDLWTIHIVVCTMQKRVVGVCTWISEGLLGLCKIRMCFAFFRVRQMARFPSNTKRFFPINVRDVLSPFPPPLRPNPRWCRFSVPIMSSAPPLWTYAVIWRNSAFALRDLRWLKMTQNTSCSCLEILWLFSTRLFFKISYQRLGRRPGGNRRPSHINPD